MGSVKPDRLLPTTKNRPGDDTTLEYWSVGDEAFPSATLSGVPHAPFSHVAVESATGAFRPPNGALTKNTNAGMANLTLVIGPALRRASLLDWRGDSAV